MNENPEGTPNPLNPTPQPASTPAPSAPTGVNAAENNPPVPPVTNPVTPASNEKIEPITAEQLVTPAAAQPVAPVVTTTPEPAKPVAAHPATHNAGRVVDPMMVRGPHAAPINRTSAAPVAAPAAPTQAVANPAPMDLTDDADAIIQQLSQNTDQPHIAEPTVAQPKKKKSKTGLIVAAIILVLAAVGCAVAAILILNPFAKDDRVPVAIEKMLSGQMPTSIAVNGTISASSDAVESGVNALDISLNAQFNTANGTNTASATVTAGFTDDTEISFDAEELTTEDSDVFLRFSGLGKALTSLNSGLQVQNVAVESPAENCVEVGEGVTECNPVEEVTEVVTTCEGEACEVIQQNTSNVIGGTALIMNMLSSMDEEWIRIPLNSTTSDDPSILNNPAQCLTNALSELPNYGGQIKALYTQNPFIEYSTENLAITARKDRLYRLSINNQLFTNFVNSLKGNEFANELLACTNGTATNDGLTLDQVTTMFESYPTMYVEINDQYYFTRVVFDSTLTNDASVRADLNLSYPASISVIAPEEYIEMNDAIQAMIQDLYGISTDTTEPVPGDVPPAPEEQPQQ